VFAFGDATFEGSVPGLPNSPRVNDIVGVAPTASGRGYLLIGSDGVVFAFGDATFEGSVPGLPGSLQVNDIVGVAPTASGKGYWMVGSDGGVFSFGDATFMGSLPGMNVHVSDVVSSATDPPVT
jgi:hypothetical protein